MIIVNGKKYNEYDGVTLEEVILKLEYDKSKIAIELNGDIISRDKYQSVEMKDGDQMEVVSFVGGG